MAITDDDVLAKARAYAWGGKPATEDAVRAIEQAFGLTMPPLLRRIYLEIADGGIGPDEKETMYRLIPLAKLAGERATVGAPAHVLPIINWGCGTYSCVDTRSAMAPVLAVDIDGDLIVVDHLDTLAAFLDAWLEAGTMTMFEKVCEQIGPVKFA